MKEIGSEFSHCSIEDYYFNRITNIGNTVRFLRCGRDAIGYIADLLKRKSGILLMPAYCCDSMVQPFIVRGWKVEYYPINTDFSVDIEFIISAFSKNSHDALLLMNFYGISDTNKSINLIRTRCRNLQIIEDITHVIFDVENIYSEQVDYYIGSIRKWMGITDGAIVISTKKEIPEIEYQQSDFVTLRQKGLCIKEQYHHSNDSSIKLIYRNFLSDAENSLDNGKIPHSISPTSQYMLDHINFAPLKNKRKLNTQLLLKLLKTIPKINFPLNIDLILENTPFSLPILVNDRDKIQKAMAERGIYVAVLWPLNEDARKKSDYAAELEKTMLSIPVDQRYEAADMEQIYNVIKLSLS